MGTCCYPNSNYIYRAETVGNIQHGTGIIIDMKENINEEIFPNMPEVPGRFTGLGIKKMPAYKCSLNIDELNILRDHFWKVKIAVNERYKYLRQAILYDSNKCEEYILKNGFITLDGCINQVTDSSNNLYSIPNYCINDPYFERVILPVDNKQHDKVLNLYLSENDNKTLISVNEGASGADLKKVYKELRKYGEISLRMFFGGKEIKDNEFIYQHKIHNNYIIQVIKV